MNAFKNHRYTFLALLMALMILISSCGKKENYNLVNQNEPETATTATPTIAPTETLENSQPSSEETLNYDPLSEEDTGELVETPNEDSNTVDNTAAIASPEDDSVFGSPIDAGTNNTDSTGIKYAGATPIPILPIDVPTPTPQQALQFTYQEYSAEKLNLKFQAPAAWEVDDSQQDAYVLKEPLTNQKDGFSAEVVIRAIPLSKEYSSSDLSRELKTQLEQMGLLNYTSWSPSLSAKRDLLGKSGLYANYRGTLANGVRIRSRLHMVAIGTTLYSLQITGPSKYNTDFIGVHTHIRRSLSFINTQSSSTE